MRIPMLSSTHRYHYYSNSGDHNTVSAVNNNDNVLASGLPYLDWILPLQPSAEYLYQWWWWLWIWSPSSRPYPSLLSFLLQKWCSQRRLVSNLILPCEVNNAHGNRHHQSSCHTHVSSFLIFNFCKFDLVLISLSVSEGFV